MSPSIRRAVFYLLATPALTSVWFVLSALFTEPLYQLDESRFAPLEWPMTWVHAIGLALLFPVPTLMDALHVPHLASDGMKFTTNCLLWGFVLAFFSERWIRPGPSRTSKRIRGARVPLTDEQIRGAR